MQFNSNLKRNIPLPKQEVKEEKGFFEKWLPFLAALWKKEKKSGLIETLYKVTELYKNLGANVMLYLEINDSEILKDKKGVGYIENLPGFMENTKEYVKSAYITLRKEAGNLVITSNVRIELLPSKNHVSISVNNYGMVQIPKSVKVGTFEEDIEEVLKNGYLEECERAFTIFTELMGREFQKIFNTDPMISKPEKMVIVPAEKNRKLAKFYNRKFISQEKVYSPSFYKDSGISPAYQMGGYTDPFEIYWWMMIFNSFSGGSDANVNTSFMDSGGNEITKEQASALSDGIDQTSLTKNLSETADTFSGNSETFSQAVQAVKYEENPNEISSNDDNGKKAHSSSDVSSAAVVGDTTTTGSVDTGSCNADAGCADGGGGGGCSGGCGAGG